MILDHIYGVEVIAPPQAHASVATICGFPMIVDPTLPPNVIEFRDATGRVVSRAVLE